MLKRVRQIQETLLDMEAYERWGHGTDAAMNEKLENAGDYHREREELVSRLKAGARTASDATLAEWAAAHIELLERYIARMEKAEGRSRRTEISVAQDEREAWERLARREIELVDQNTHYVRYDSKRYKKYFGFAY